MAFFNRFPYTNFHELNLDWILKQINDIIGTAMIRSVNHKTADSDGNVELTADDIGGVVTKVNNTTPDSDGNVNVGTVKKVNSTGPDSDGNVDVGTVKSVNRETPDSDGDVLLVAANIPGVVRKVNGQTPDAAQGNVNVGTVKSVNNTTPDADGNVSLPTVAGVTSVNEQVPDGDGNVTLTPANVGAYPRLVRYIGGEIDLNDNKTTGMFYFSSGVTLSNAPNSATDGFLMVFTDANADIVKQIWFRVGTNPNTSRDAYERLYANSTWGDWTEISGYSDPSITPATVSGFTITDFQCKRKNGFVVVECTVEVTATPNNNSYTIATLPTGYRPPMAIKSRTPGQSSGHYFNVDISTSGAVSVSRNPTQVAAKGRIYIMFPTDN